MAAGALLSPEMLAEAVTPQCAGPDRVFGDDTAWGLGFGISEDGYGMGGLGGTSPPAPAAPYRQVAPVVPRNRAVPAEATDRATIVRALRNRDRLRRRSGL